MMAPKILIVDDDSFVQATLNLRLRRYGFDTVFAADAAQALRLTLLERPDLLLLDLGLPGQDGFAVMEELRQMGAAGAVPVIVISARQRAGDLQRVRRLGAWSYLAKPLDEDQLLVAIEGALTAGSAKTGPVPAISSTG